MSGLAARTGALGPACCEVTRFADPPSAAREQLPGPFALRCE